MRCACVSGACEDRCPGPSRPRSGTAAIRPASKSKTKPRARSSSSTPVPESWGSAKRSERSPRDVTIVLTHYHWDHLQGLPFFNPLYVPGCRVQVFAPAFESHDPEWVSTIFRSPFFPVPHERLPNRPDRRADRTGRVSRRRARDLGASAQSSRRGIRLPHPRHDGRSRLRHGSRVRQIPRFDERAGRLLPRRCRGRPRRPLHSRGTAAASRLGTQRLAAVRRVRACVQCRRTVAVPPQAGSNRRAAGAGSAPTRGVFSAPPKPRAKVSGWRSRPECT